jgi:outer membrane protein OmpA-like peptidoglycan-associated protein
MSGVLFKTGQAKLMPTAREKLAKVAGILAVHKGIKIEADGFTDSTGPAEVNEKLSESRAQAARDFLVSQGVPPDAIVSKGFGPENPIADNSTPTGRQENRRVELVVSGEGITNPTQPASTPAEPASTSDQP